MDYMFAICFFHSGRFEDLHEDFLTRNNIYVKWWLNLENTMTKSKTLFYYAPSESYKGSK